MSSCLTFIPQTRFTFMTHLSECNNVSTLLTFFVTMAADHIHLRAIVDMVFGHVEGKSSIATKALSIKCGQHPAYKDIFVKLVHPFSTHGQEIGLPVLPSSSTQKPQN